MIKIIYLLGMFVGNIAFIAAAKVLIQPSGNSESIFTAEWVGLILLSFIGFVFIYRSAWKIKKLDTYKIAASHEFGTIGGKDV